MGEMRKFAHRGGLWIAWPKKSSGVASDLSGSAVREVGLAAGLVDFKVCAIDATWSGLRFTRRKAKQLARERLTLEQWRPAQDVNKRFLSGPTPAVTPAGPPGTSGPWPRRRYVLQIPRRTERA